MDTRKKAIIEALTRFAEQRPGLDFRNYGSVPTFRSEQRAIARDLREARVLLRAAALDNRVTADGLLEAARSAFSGRLSIEGDYEFAIGDIRIDYCVGQYWPTEYRKAVCAVLASALWYAAREEITADRANDAHGTMYQHASVGDALRAHFRRRFGAPIQRRWFN